MNGSLYDHDVQMIRMIQFLPIIVGIANVKEPFPIRLNRDANMTAGVADKRDEQDLRRKPFEITDRLEAKPVFAATEFICAPIDFLNP